MNNCKLDYKNQVIADTKTIILGNAKSYKVSENEVFIPKTEGGKIDTVNKAFKVAERKVEEVNTKYNSRVTSINNGYTQGVGINIHPSQELIDELYEIGEKVKDENAARLQQQIDASRQSIGEDLFDEYDDDYLFDDMPGTSDGYNYALYTETKSEIRDAVSQRLRVLEQMTTKDTKAHLQQIAQLKEVQRRLNKDLKNLEDENHQLENFFGYFNRDLNIIHDILLDNPTEENLNIARNFIDSLGLVKAVQGPRFSENPYTDLEGEARRLFNDFIVKIDGINKMLLVAEDKLKVELIEKVNINPETKSAEEQNAEEELTTVAKAIDKTSSYLSAKLLPIDADKDANPIQLFVRKVYDNIVGKQETFKLRDKLLNIKPKLEKELKKLGHTATDGFFGKLSTAVNYDIFKRLMPNGNNRLVGKFSNQWTTLENDTKRRLEKIKNQVFKKNKDKQDYTKIRNSRIELFDSLKNEVNFIDVRKIPALINHPDLQASFGSFFSSIEEAEAYEKQLIQSLVGKSGNVQVAERIYNDIIQQQLENLFLFEISMQNYKKTLFQKNGVTSIEALPEGDRNSFLTKYYTESPFAFAENHEQSKNQTNPSGSSFVKNVQYANGKRFETETEVSTLEYQSFLPAAEEYFDESFEENIASNPLLYEAWELFSDALKYINNNRKYTKGDSLDIDDLLTSERDFAREHHGSTLGLLRYFKKSVLDRIKEMRSTSKYVDTTKVKLHGTVQSIDKVIQTQSKPLIAVLSAMGVDFNQTYDITTFPKQAAEYIANNGGLQYITSGDGVANPMAIVRNMTRDKVLRSQKLDLIDTLTSQLETVEKFKAHKEIETTLLFAKNQMAKVENDKYGMELVTNFINLHLYGVNNRKNWTIANRGQIGPGGKVVRNSQELELKKLIEDNISLIEELTKNSSKEVKEQAQRDIAELQKMIDNQGRVKTTGSVFEFYFMKVQILTGLGMNATSQIHNWSIGNLALRQNDGLEWTEGNAAKAYSYTRKWKIVKRKLYRGESNGKTPNFKKKYKITNTLIDSLGIFQNSANEIDKIRETGYKNKAHKYISNPLHLIGEVEKTIQRPQILSALGDIEITDNDGNKVPIFDVNNLSNPHPAFDLDAQGNLKLKPEFDNEANRATWINRSSDEYADLFGESGKVPSIIARINGDYRETSDTGIKKHSATAILMMFKTWLPAYILRRYGKEHGVITNLIKGGRQDQAGTVVGMTQAMAFFTGTSLVAGPLVGLAVTLSFLGAKKFKAIKNSELNTIDYLSKEIKRMSLVDNLLVNTARTGAGISVKMAQQITNRVVGRPLIKNSTIDKIAGFDKMTAFENQSEFKKNKARLNFLMVEASTAASMLMLKILVNMLMMPDDDEAKEFKEEDFVEKMKNHPDIIAYYALENYLTRFQREINLMNDPFELAETIGVRTIDNLYDKTLKIPTGIVAQFGDNPTYQSGVNKGRNKLEKGLVDFFVPRGYSDLALGIDNYTKSDKSPKDIVNEYFESDAKKLKREWEKRRKEYKKERTEYYKGKYSKWGEDRIKKKAQADVDKEYPTIKDYFNEDGTVKKGKEKKVKRYRK